MFKGLALTLIATVAKHLAEALLGKSLATSLVDNLIDFTKEEGGQRLFSISESEKINQIGKKVAQDLVPFFKHETKGFDEGTRNAIVIEVIRTLSLTEINARVLIQRRLRAEDFSEYLLNARTSESKRFSTNENSVFELLLQHSGTAIMAVATTFSGFEQDLAAKVLDDLEKILDGIIKQQRNAEENEKQYEKKYLDLVSYQLDRMEVFGFPKLDEETKRQSLSVAYVTLDVTQRGGAPIKNDMSEPLDAFRETEFFHLRLDDEQEKQPEENGSPVKHEGFSGPIDRILTQSRRIVIIGDAGSGKSTLMQWVAVRAARNDFPPHLAGWKNSIPFFIRLRQFAGNNFPGADEFPNILANTIKGEKPIGWVEKQLDSGRAIVLVDGVDELPELKRVEMLEELKKLLIAYPLARYVITSRPAALKEWRDWKVWISEKKFTSANMQAMNIGHIDQFIDHWHQALLERTREPEERVELQGNPPKLKQLIRDRTPIRRLATNPLLCAMICALYRVRKDNLPERRNKLYEECVEMLLDRRERGRGIDLGEDYPKLDYDQKLSLIQPFAYWMMRNNKSDVSIEKAEVQFENRLPRLGISDTGARTRKLFVERTNLLQEPIEGRVEFTHRTFQEYLAAREAVRVDDIDFLASKRTDYQWRETIILAAGEARPSEAENLLSNLIKPSLFAPKGEKYLSYLLAVACLETAVELEPQLRQKVIDKAKELFPPKSDDDAKMIAAAGDIAVGLLRLNITYKEEEARLSARALGQIGTARALEALAEYINEKKVDYQDVTEFWDKFDRPRFAKAILGNFESLEFPSSTASLDGLETLKDLLALIIGDTQVSDLTPLAGLTNLQALYIWNTQVSDLTPLAGLTNLQILDTRRIQVTNLTPLAELTNLRELYIGYTQLNDLAVLAGLTNLQKLYIPETKLNDLAVLAGLTNLQVLIIEYMQASDLTPLAELTNLQELSIGGAQVTDLTPLAELTNLQELSIWGAQVTDLTPLAGLTNLQELSIGQAQVTDLTPLAGLTNLQKLYIGDTQVSDLTPLAGLTNLQELSIGGAQVNDLTPLAELTSLQEVDIYGTWVSARDIKQLQEKGIKVYSQQRSFLSRFGL